MKHIYMSTEDIQDIQDTEDTDTLTEDTEDTLGYSYATITHAVG